MSVQTIIKTHEVKVLDEQGNPIKDEKGKFVKEIVSKEYRIDADFVPSAIEDICIEFIDNYVEANNQGEWLLKQLEKKEVYKKGKKIGQEKEISFVSLRSFFANEFFKDIVKGAGKKEENFRNKLLAKYKK